MADVVDKIRTIVVGVIGLIFVGIVLFRVTPEIVSSIDSRYGWIMYVGIGAVGVGIIIRMIEDLK
jgi:hypothetical protein